jgi:hypothetical protein
MERKLKNALWLLYEFDVSRYLISIQRHDGFEKAQRHTSICQKYIAVRYCLKTVDFLMITKPYDFMEIERYLHGESQYFTSDLYKRIGYPLDGSYLDLETLALKFHHGFVKEADHICDVWEDKQIEKSLNSS